MKGPQLPIPVPTPPIPIKSFLTTLEAGSKYGLRLNCSNLKIIEHPGTLVLEMKNLDLEEIEEFLTQSLGVFFKRICSCYFILFLWTLICVVVSVCVMTMTYDSAVIVMIIVFASTF